MEEEIKLIKDELEIINDFSKEINLPCQSKPISKTQMKKIKKQMEWETKKKEIRQKKKMIIKEKKRIKREAEVKEYSNKNEGSNLETCSVVKLPKKVWEEQYLTKLKEGIKVIIDCDFEDLMNDKDAGSLVRQIAFCYSVNRKANYPFNYFLYDVGEKINIHLMKNNFDNWIGVKSVKKGEWKYISDYLSHITNNECKKENIVYLTADSENEITELKREDIYLIGGIVDRNRYKLITLNKANELGLRHAKLPIEDYIHLNSSKVLTTNHVFSILSYYINIKNDWKEAFMSIIPKRKIEE